MEERTKLGREKQASQREDDKMTDRLDVFQPKINPENEYLSAMGLRKD